MKKVVLMTALSSAIILGGAGLTHAAEGDQAKELNPEGYDSKGTVTVKAYDPEVDPTPVTPLDPDPQNPGGTGDLSMLSIDQVPNFNFAKPADDKDTDSRGIYNDEIVYQKDEAGNPISEKFVKNVQVTDRRQGDQQTGWTLGLSVSKFTTEDKTKVLGKSKMTIPLAISTKSNNTSTAPTIKGTDGTKATITVPTEDTQATVNIASANSYEGLGSWVITTDGASMELPGGVEAGEYQGTLNWKMDNAPV